MILLFLLTIFSAAQSTGKQVYYVTEEMTVTTTPGPFAAYVEYRDLIESTGWSFLTVHTNSTLTDQAQARAAGIGEGYVTAERIYQSWNNTMATYCSKPSPYCTKLMTYMLGNKHWLNDMIEQHSATCPYWYHVELIKLQIEGMWMGFNMVYPDTLNPGQFFMMNMMGDLIDLEAAFSSTDHYLEDILGQGHCSAFVKWTGDDLLTSHVTWNNYVSMIRIVKEYHLNYKSGPGSSTPIPGTRQVFTSYPGFIFSGDDYTLIGSGLAAQETTIGNFNADLWQYLSTNDSIPEYMRGVLANRLAVNGESWCKTFEKFNSGTYNNQWTIVDYNLFTPGMETLNEGTLYVLEQLPGTIVYKDRTEALNKQRYWPSYNTPSFPQIFNLSGSQELVDKFGPMFSYDENPRALIFARDEHTVTDMASLYKLMRYNDYQHDPLSICSACTPPYSAVNAIASRSDLNPVNGSYPLPFQGHMLSGAVDYKGTNYSLMKVLGMRVAGGPTWDQQPPFRWSDWPEVAPIGMTDLQQFTELSVVFEERETVV